ncbi:hypothetical protein KTT_01790 [Tengunoibacter tsumagoiensis]|uniref:Uncharacterized protein n=1 Tax=Tengunoibacter tsumagoiensis TaxID=2014871 RepID=A0A401ZU77_9CHLR|nr:hypothetical protein KTT_01790 [Tengunoibacter tsumagoiensis]
MEWVTTGIMNDEVCVKREASGDRSGGEPRSIMNEGGSRVEWVTTGIMNEGGEQGGVGYDGDHE